MAKTLEADYKGYLNHVLTERSLTVVTHSDPIQLTDKDPRFDDACEMVRSGKFDALMTLISKDAAIRDYTRGMFTFLPTGEIKITENDEVLPPVLGARMVQFMDAGLDYAPLLKFWNRLKENPDPNILEQAYAFLEHNHATFLADGKLLLYKKVADDFSAWHKDAKGEKVYWKVGTTVTMPREECDSNPEQTCSAGLHAAAFGYANNFSGSQLIELVVDPADIVAIPHDYNNQKLRLCKAYVQSVNVDGAWQVLTDSKVRRTTALSEAREEIVTAIKRGRRVTLPVSGQGYLNIPAPIVRLMKFEPGDVIYVAWPSTRHKCLRLGRKRTVVRKDTPFFTETKVLVNGNARVRLSSFREAGIDGVESYAITKQPGNVLEIRG